MYRTVATYCYYIAVSVTSCRFRQLYSVTDTFRIGEIERKADVLQQTVDVRPAALSRLGAGYRIDDYFSMGYLCN